MNRRNKQLQALSAVQFALWELHLYLDTHPDDLQALSLHEKYEVKFAKLRAAYEEDYGPLTPVAGEGISWLKDPWPWDKDGGED
ncbi:MAG: spore coat protein CotJB [Clostridia bacterium]|nr:spore coat protein CotJB [Clostridia bacterium]MBR0510620.1 spore coat protein CotJB [Clostridia bacterium]MBR0537321.1 spore coat protein CotJB [Clostridia bacterium]